MNPKIEKLAKDIEKNKAKIAEPQARLRDLEKPKTELENSAVVAGGRRNHMTDQELAGSLKQGQTAT